MPLWLRNLPFLAIAIALGGVCGAQAEEPKPPSLEKASAELDALLEKLGTKEETGKAMRRPSTKTLGLGQVEISVFGLEGIGRKFVFAFDRSLSMSEQQGRPLAAAKAELIDSLQDLGSVHQFQIVFYNEKPHVMNLSGGTPRFAFGDDASKRAASAFVRDIAAAGGTHHMDALKLAIGMQPDVIFFLTDADEPGISAAELGKVKLWNRSEATIHTIEFGSGPSSGEENFMTRLSSQNHGKHVYIDVTKLPKK